MQGIKTGGYYCGVGRHCGRRERKVSEEVPFKLRHEQRLDNFMSVPTAGFTLETNTRACSESLIWNSWSQISTEPLTLLAMRSHFSSPLLIYYFPNLQYLSSLDSAEDPASYSTKQRVALTNCLENKIFSRCLPPRWPLMLPFSFLLLSMNLLGDYTRFSFHFDPRSFALWLPVRWLQLHSNSSLSYIFLFLSLPDQSNPQSPVWKWNLLLLTPRSGPSPRNGHKAHQDPSQLPFHLLSSLPVIFLISNWSFIQSQ